jgi:internalin A
MVKDLSVDLNSLTKLHTLDLVGSISAVHGLSSTLTDLDLRLTHFSDLGALRHLVSLTRLDISGSSVDDLQGLSSFQCLRELNLGNGDPFDWWDDDLELPTVESVQLSYYACGSDHNEIDVTLIADTFPNLVRLDLSGSNACNVESLSACQKLITLVAEDDVVPYYDCDHLASLTTLTELNLKGSHMITNINGLSQLGQLRKLNLSRTSVEDLSPLRELTKLTCLDVSDTYVSGLRPLSQLKLYHLEIRNVAACFEGLHVQELLHLDMRITRVRSLHSLGPALCPSLVVVSRLLMGLVGQIESIDFLRGANSLCVLMLDGSEVTDLSVLTALPSLRWLDVENTRLEGCQELSQLARNIPHFSHSPRPAS